MSTRKIKTWLNSQDFKTEGEKNTLPSMTVPEQDMSIREIVKNFVSGKPFNVPGQLVNDQYSDDEEDVFPDVKNMDLAEIEQMTADNLETIRQLKERLKLRKQSSKVSKAEELEFTPVEKGSQAPAPQSNNPKKAPPEGPPAGPPEAKN